MDASVAGCGRHPVPPALRPGDRRPCGSDPFPWGGVPFGLAVGSQTVWFSGAFDESAYPGSIPRRMTPLEPVSVGSGTVTDIVLGGGGCGSGQMMGH